MNPHLPTSDSSPAGPAPHAHHTAAIISTGDELALGQTLDTNSRWIAQQLTARGIRVREHVTVGDDLDSLTTLLRRLADAVPLVVLSGGLGPTLDDLTRQALADVLNEPLTTDERALERLSRLFAARGRALTDLQRLQATRPVSARMIDNPTGTAPGLHAMVRTPGAHGGCDVFCLPGPPGELQPMFHDSVAPALRPPPGATIATRVLPTIGTGEGDIAKALGDLMQRGRNPSVGTTASGGIVTVRLRFEGDAAHADAELNAVQARVRTALGELIFSDREESLASAVLRELRARARRLVVVESCTGGSLGAMLTEVPGSSAAFTGGWMTYANHFKQAGVGVEPALIEKHGAVSEPVARAMALGGLAHPASDGAHHALAITGVAGPDGGSEAKPVGTVFVAHAQRDGAIDVRRFRIPGDRAAVRDRAAKMALAMLRFALIGSAQPRLLWQVNADGSAIAG